jgi:hypothetical protein
MPDISHLFSDAEPDFLPRPQELEDPTQVIGGGGIRIHRSRDDILIGMTEDPPQASAEVDETPGGDPLAYMSFRGKKVVTPAGLTVESPAEGEPSVRIQTGYVNSIYWEDGWVHESREIQEDYILIEGYPKYLYLKFPVTWISGLDTPDLTFPEGGFSSEGQTINGGEYFFIMDTTTGLLVRDRTTVQPVDFRYFVLTDTLKNSLASDEITFADGSESTYSGYYYFLLGRLMAESGFQQTHMGVLTLPQSYNFNITRLVVST